MRRDFTHIDDVARVVSSLVNRVPGDNVAAGNAPARIYNVGNHHPEELLHVVALLRRSWAARRKRICCRCSLEMCWTPSLIFGDLMRDTGFKPATTIEDGIRDFVAWYRDH